MHFWISLCIEFHFEQTIFNFWTKFVQERYLCSKTEKVNIIIEFRIFKLALLPNFSLTDRFDFFDQIYPKRVFFWSKTEKMNTTYFPHNSAYSNWSSAKFQLKLIILIFWTNLPKKSNSNRKQKSEYHYWILHIWISLGTKGQLKLTISIFLTRFTQKEFFWSKTEKVNNTCFLHNSAYSY